MTQPPTPRTLQELKIRHSFGLPDHHARLIAALAYGELHHA